MTSPMRHHLLSLSDLDDEELNELVRRGVRFATAGVPDHRPLSGCVVGIYFRRTSTRTRTSFSAGALRLGAGIVTFGPDDLQLNTGETAADTGRVLSGMLDCLVARTCGTMEELRELAADRRMPVVNAMSEAEHPTQALADLTTLMITFGELSGLRVLYVGEGNNTAAALALALTRYPKAELHLLTPPGYGIAASTAATAAAQAARTGAVLSEAHDPAAAPRDVDVVYTTRWQTTGTSKPDPAWREVFAPFQVDSAMLAARPGAVFMHDLPAHRGEEVTVEVLDGPDSMAFPQAVNKLHSAMAVLEWCVGGP
jgi:ornithine carbamoyltransferase